MKGGYSYKGTGIGIDEAAAWDYIRQGHLFSPRTVLKGRIKHNGFVLPDIAVDRDNMSDVVQQKLETALVDAHGSRRAVMFSGGFDSILIASLARRCGAKVTAMTVQFENYNSLTVDESAQSAKQHGFAHHVIPVKISEYFSAFEAFLEVIDEPVMDLDLPIVYAALKKYDNKIAGNTIISGMGSDQWFGNEAWDSLEVRLDWALIDKAAHQKVAQAHGCQFVFPFLSGFMLALSRSIPKNMKKDKKLLRALAVANTIPHRGARSEVQVPYLIRRVLIKMYGHRAWPAPVSVGIPSKTADNQKLRQIILGLWLEKAKKRKLLR